MSAMNSKGSSPRSHTPAAPRQAGAQNGPAMLRVTSEATTGVCLITMARNEPVFLTHWIWYYSQALDRPKFILLDDASDPAMVRDLRARFPKADLDVIRLPEGPFHDQYKSNALSAMAAIAVERFAVVITTDADEIVVPIGGDRGRDLFDALRAAPRPFTAPIGVEPVHDVENERPFDPCAPVGQQRAFGRLRSGFCKPCVWQGEPWVFSPGQHGLRQRRVPVNPNLALVHLKFVDASALQARQRERIARTYSAQQRPGMGRHWQVPPERQMSKPPFNEMAEMRAAEVLSKVIPAYLEEHFDPVGGGYVMKDLRRIMPVSLKGEL